MKFGRAAIVLAAAAALLVVGLFGLGPSSIRIRGSGGGLRRTLSGGLQFGANTTTTPSPATTGGGGGGNASTPAATSRAPRTAAPGNTTTTTTPPAASTTAGPATTKSSTASPLCLQCFEYIDDHPDDDTCESIQKGLGLDCSTCGCSNDVDPFLHSVEFYLAVAAGCVFVIAAIFVAVCLVRRNRATANFTTSGDDATLLAGDGFDNDPKATTGGYTAPTMDGDVADGAAPGGGLEYARVRYDFTADPAYDEQLSVNKNDRVLVLEKFDDGWWNVTHVDSGRRGIVPASYCTSEV